MTDSPHDQFGWQFIKPVDGERGVAFHYGPFSYTENRVEPALGSDQLKLRNRYLVPAKGGSLQRWSRAANSLFAKGCEPQSFALLCAFAAPLMRLFPGGEGGVVVSLVDAQPDSGKAAPLEAAASVWGREDGLKIHDDDTKAMALGGLGHLPVLYDELHGRDPDVIRSFLQSFTDGEVRDGVPTCRTIMVLASHHSVVDVLGGVAGGDAVADRVLEHHIKAPKIVRKADDVRRELKANSGWAGDAYLRRLVQPETLAWLSQGLPQWTEQVQDRTRLPDKYRFWVRTVAAVVAASQIVKGLGILEFSPQRIVAWALDDLRDRTRPGVTPEARQPVNILREFLDDHARDMLVVPRAWCAADKYKRVTPLMVPTGSNGMIGRHEIENGRIYILETFMRKWLKQKGVEPKPMMAALFRCGVLVRDGKPVTLGAGTEYASRQVTAYEINAKHPAMSGLLVPEEVVQQMKVGI